MNDKEHEMCEESDKAETIRFLAAQRGEDPGVQAMPATGSRRHRLWELAPVAHCPVIGVCVPIERLRHLAVKAWHETPSADDYILHCDLVAECRRRSSMTEALQKDLDRRYVVSLRHVTRLKTAEDLLRFWNAALGAHDIAGPLWAVLTHARTTTMLREHILGDVHMLQHQVGAATRVAARRLEGLSLDNEDLGAQLREARAALARERAEAAEAAGRQSTELMRVRGELLARTAAAQSARDELAALRASIPDLASRTELTRLRERDRELLAQAQSELGRTRAELERLRRSEPVPMAAAPAVAASDPAAGPPADLADRAVLCVGGRTSHVPVYRDLIESGGARFLHHDGGAEDSVTRLDATLAAADLVICQAGCVSHDAYWRVKDHCKRTGKPCVFVDNPSAAGLKRALAVLGRVEAA